MQSDPQLYVWHASNGTKVAASGGGLPPADGKKASRLVLILSTHVDDFKGAGEAHYRQRLNDGLEKAFSTLKIKFKITQLVSLVR